MSVTGTEAARQAADGAPGMVGAMLGRLADRLGGKASVTAAFGEPVVSGDVTVIPVARVGFGFGGGTARYRPIRDLWGDVVLPLAALAAGLIAPKVARLIARRSLR